MSKNSGGKSRRPPHPPGPDKDEKRPSVFERLGIRSHSGRHSTSVEHPHPHEGGRWPESLRHGSSTRDSEGRSRAGPAPGSSDKRHSSSYSPPEMSTSKSHGHVGKPLGSLLTGSFSNPNTSPSKRIKDPSKKPNRPEEKHGQKKTKKRTSGGGGVGGSGGTTSKKQTLDKKRSRKGRTSSASSGDSSDSSSSPSSSSSTSSSSNNSSSSDSSVPSVKLSSEKTKVKNVSKVKGDKSSKRPVISAPPPPSASASAYHRSSRSSSSGLDSNSVKRGPVPIDLREKLNARSPSGSQKRLGGGGDIARPVKGYDRGPSPLLDVDRYKKRPAGPDPFLQDDVKRRRMLSPSPVDKYRVLPPQGEPPHHHRRAPPQMHDVPKPRGRSPNFHKDQQHSRSGNSPGRRLDMQRRPERLEPHPRNNDDRDRRGSPFHPKSDYDKRRDPLPEFGRGDNRPRERVAPSRTPIMEFRQERERMDRPPPHDYQRRSQSRTPYNQNPADQQQGRNYNYKGTSSPYETERQNQRFPNPQLVEEKRQPLIPKSKEALAERYEQMRKSGYVDKWVDETVKSTQRGTRDEAPSPLISTPSSKSALSPDRPKLDDIITKELKDEGTVIPAIDVDDLSDFSDDADELLNVAPDSPLNTNEDDTAHANLDTPGSVSSSMAGSSKKELMTVDKPANPEIPGSSTKQRSTSVETGPSTFSQERLLVAKLGGRLQTSVPSQSQTDDLLDGMDFEEISDEEVENTADNIVDALGVDWASLVCDKRSDGQTPESQSKSTSARKRWRPINILSGRISKELAGETLYNKILELKKAEDAADSGETKDDESIEKTPRPRDMGVLEKIGLGPNSRALSARRDMAVRRHLLDLPPKSLLSLDLFHNNTATTTPEMDSIGELYKMSIAVFKASSRAVALS